MTEKIKEVKVLLAKQKTAWRRGGVVRIGEGSKTAFNNSLTHRSEFLLRVVAEFANENQSLIHALRSDLSDRKAVSAQGLLTNRTTSKREPPGRSDNKGGFCVTSVSSLALTEAPAPDVLAKERPPVRANSVNDVC